MFKLQTCWTYSREAKDRQSIRKYHFIASGYYSENFLPPCVNILRWFVVGVEFLGSGRVTDLTSLWQMNCIHELDWKPCILYSQLWSWQQSKAAINDGWRVSSCDIYYVLYDLVKLGWFEFFNQITNYYVFAWSWWAVT